MSGEGGAIAEVLAAHVQVTGYDEIGVWFNYACSCSAFGDSDEWHREHVAEVLADLLAAEWQRGREEALREAAKEAEERGDIGKDGGCEAWDWLAIRADQAASIARTPDESEAR